MKKIFLISTILIGIITFSFIYYSNRNHPVDLPAKVEAQTSENDWPQVQKDPQHTGYSSETLGTNFKVTWTYPFQPDRVHPQVQAIIYRGKVFVGTEGANGQKPTLYAIDATAGGANSGQVVWKYEVGGPILNSVAADNGKVYFASLDGAVYAIYTDTENGHTQGTLAWKQQLSQRLGFSVAPVIADNKVMLGGRDGIFYALDPNDGQIVWQSNIGSPILQTAAFNNGKVFFGTQDMYVYALNTADGSLSWKSNQIKGLAFKDYWPVVYQGKVFIRPVANIEGAGITPGFPFWWFDTNNSNHWSWLSQWGQTIATGRASLVPDLMNAQDTIISNYQANPQNYSENLYILDENNGQNIFAVPQWTTQTHDGTTTPPCVDRDGNLVVPLMFIKSGWGRLDPESRRIIDILYDGYDRNGQPVDVANTNPAGFGNPDEDLNVTCSGNLILGFHMQETNANYTGYFNQDTRRWTLVGAGQRSGQMTTNTQGSVGNPPSISNGMIYHISWHELIVRTTN